MKKLNTAVNTIAEHFAGFALSENLDTNTYTPEKGCLENLIRGSEIGLNSCMNLMHDIGVRLKQKRRDYDGSEIATTSIESEVVAIKKLLEQKVAYEQFIQVSKISTKKELDSTTNQELRKLILKLLRIQRQRKKLMNS